MFTDIRNIVCDVYKRRLINICDIVYYLKWHSVDTESKLFGDCQFQTYTIIEPNGSKAVDLPLYTVTQGMMGRMNYLVRNSGI